MAYRKTLETESGEVEVLVQSSELPGMVRLAVGDGSGDDRLLHMERADVLRLIEMLQKATGGPYSELKLEVKRLNHSLRRHVRDHETMSMEACRLTAIDNERGEAMVDLREQVKTLQRRVEFVTRLSETKLDDWLSFNRRLGMNDWVLDVVVDLARDYATVEGNERRAKVERLRAVGEAGRELRVLIGSAVGPALDNTLDALLAADLLAEETR